MLAIVCGFRLAECVNGFPDEGIRLGLMVGREPDATFPTPRHETRQIQLQSPATSRASSFI